MANHKQAAKRARQNEKRRMRNRSLSSKVKTFIKKMMSAVQENNEPVAKELLPVVIKEIMNAGTKGIFHRNKVSRKVSQMQKAYNKLTVKPA